MKKVLILTASFAEGHNTAARNIRDALDISRRVRQSLTGSAPLKRESVACADEALPGPAQSHEHPEVLPSRKELFDPAAAIEPCRVQGFDPSPGRCGSAWRGFSHPCANPGRARVHQ